MGVKFLWECTMGLREPNHFGAVLADEMGLGYACLLLMRWFRTHKVL